MEISSVPSAGVPGLWQTMTLSVPACFAALRAAFASALACALACFAASRAAFASALACALACFAASRAAFASALACALTCCAPACGPAGLAAAGVAKAATVSEVINATDVTSETVRRDLMASMRLGGPPVLSLLARSGRSKVTGRGLSRPW